jgi:hypothetical protein
MVTELPEPRRDASYESRRVIAFLILRHEFIELYDVLVEALGLDAHKSAVRRAHGGDYVEVHRTGEHPAVIVIGMVAADFAASRHAQQPYPVAAAVFFAKAAHAVYVPLALKIKRARVGAVDTPEFIVERSVLER